MNLTVEPVPQKISTWYTSDKRHAGQAGQDTCTKGDNCGITYKYNTYTLFYRPVQDAFNLQADFMQRLTNRIE